MNNDLIKAKNELPHLDFSNVEEINSWYTARVYGLDDDVYLRFRKYERMDMEKEFELLQYLNPKLSVQIPKPFILWKWGDWYWYKWIHGVELSFKQLKQFPNDTNKQLIDWLAQFLYELHSITIDSDFLVKKLDVWSRPQSRWKTISNHELIDDSSIKLFTLLEKFWISQSVHISSTLVHGDFYWRNMIVDKDTYQLQWIIDFTDMSFGDIHTDFLFLFQKTIFDDVIYVYEAKWWKKIDKNIIYNYAFTFILHESLNGESHLHDRAKELVSNESYISYL